MQRGGPRIATYAISGTQAKLVLQAVLSVLQGNMQQVMVLLPVCRVTRGPMLRRGLIAA